MSGDEVAILSAKLDVVAQDVGEIKTDVRSLNEKLHALTVAVARDNVTWEACDRRQEATKGELSMGEKRAIDRTDLLGEWIKWVFYLALLVFLGLLSLVGTLVAGGKL